MQQFNLEKTKRLTLVSMLLAAAFILSWVERAVDIPVVIPGIKLGLANIVILFTICTCGKKEAVFVLVGRLILNALLFGTALSLAYSVAGGLLSFGVMCFAMVVLKTKPTAVSICGGIFHNIGQLLCAGIVMNTTAVITYLPYLILGGIVAGAINGMIVKKVSALKIFDQINNKDISAKMNNELETEQK